MTIGTTFPVLTRPDTRHKSFAVFVSALHKKSVTEGPTDKRTHGRTDTPSYRGVAHDQKLKWQRLLRSLND